MIILDNEIRGDKNEWMFSQQVGRKGTWSATVMTTYGSLLLWSRMARLIPFLTWIVSNPRGLWSIGLFQKIGDNQRSFGDNDEWLEKKERDLGMMMMINWLEERKCLMLSPNYSTRSFPQFAHSIVFFFEKTKLYEEKTTNIKFRNFCLIFNDIICQAFEPEFEFIKPNNLRFFFFRFLIIFF